MTKSMDKLHSVPRSRFTLCGTCVFICLYHKPIADVKQCISTNTNVYLLFIYLFICLFNYPLTSLLVFF